MSPSAEVVRPPVVLDATDLRILDLLQVDASLSNQALAERVHVSPATCLRRVKRLEDEGIIERRVAILSPDALGAGLTAIVEVTLDRQAAELLALFEARASAAPAVQQCYRVTGGPDFVLVVQVRDMDAYHRFANAVLNNDSNVRNVRSFFSVKRSKFGSAISLPEAG